VNVSKEKPESRLSSLLTFFRDQGFKRPSGKVEAFPAKWLVEERSEQEVLEEISVILARFWLPVHPSGWRYRANKTMLHGRAEGSFVPGE